MAFITGMLLIDAPASALNNSGEPIPGARTDNTSSVKYIRANNGKTYPYVSAQAFRYWLRNTLENSEQEWIQSPTKREEKIAYSDANPLLYWDDDLLGYMRAPSKKHEQEKIEGFTPMETDSKGKPTTVTRSSPFRVSTLVSVAPVNITTDYGTMTRHDGDPVPYEHQFYRTTLHGLISLDLNMVGKFYYQRRTGFQNLDSIRRNIADQKGLEHLKAEKAYRFDRSERQKRIRSLLLGLGELHGGAKQTVHYTDVSPAVVIFAVTQGGNHPFNYLFKENKGVLTFQKDVFADSLKDIAKHEQLLSPVYIGWKPGYMLEAEVDMKAVAVDGVTVEYGTPRTVLQQLVHWLEGNYEVWDR